MTMNTGDKRGISSEINVTPMIDVLLVLLLIIFMLIVPLIPRGLTCISAPSSEERHDPNRGCSSGVDRRIGRRGGIQN